MKRTIAAAATAALFACAAIVATASAAGSRSASGGQTTVSGLDKMWLQSSMQGDLFEIKGGKLALKLSHTRDVNALARRLMKDHTASYRDSAKIARNLGVKVENTPTPTETWELLTLAKTAASTFDRWYTSLEVADHVQDIAATTDEIQDGTNAAVIADAKQALPMLKAHLKLAKAVLKGRK
jgi:predicted outer membrane protein